jgi:hypothetical protein
MHIDERLNWREGERERDKNRCISMKRLNWRERERAEWVKSSILKYRA